MTDADDVSGDEAIAALTVELKALRRTVDELADMLARSGIIDQAQRRELARLAQPNTGCAICGKALAALAPALVLANRGRVCPICFTRGG